MPPPSVRLVFLRCRRHSHPRYGRAVIVVPRVLHAQQPFTFTLTLGLRFRLGLRQRALMPRGGHLGGALLVARAAGQRVPPVAAVQQVGAVTAAQLVVARAAKHRVVAPVAHQAVVVGLAEHLVVPLARGHHVAARTAAQEETADEYQQAGRAAVSDWLTVEFELAACGDEATVTAHVTVPSVLPFIDDFGQASRSVTMPCDD